MANRYLGYIFLIDCGMSSKITHTGALLRIGRDYVHSIRFEGTSAKKNS